MKRKYVVLLFAMLLASCSQVEQKKKQKKWKRR
ncbi:hypothetical protein BCSJ1_14430 [Bacillus cereus SJ1]|nr:hypothetical protein BCSJ1_14430 [Bacillus cereus SJ1]